MKAQMRTRPIYLDNNSTTRVDPRVLDAMWPYFAERYGNAASITHAYGLEAGEAVELARRQIGELLHAPPKSFLFTSGATEANNLAIFGISWARKSSCHLITSAAEHKAILDPINAFRDGGCDVTILEVDRYGVIDPQQIADAIQPDTVLVSIMLANNEVGSISAVQDIGDICRDRGVLFHTDATQAVGKIDVNLGQLPVDLLSFSAHKLYGPKGIGALYIRQRSPRVHMVPLLYGGGHERGLRSGTLSVPLIVGFGVACSLSRELMSAESSQVNTLREDLWKGLQSRVEGVSLNGHPEDRLPGNLSVSFRGVNSEALMMQLKEVVAISSGSACTTANPKPSHVLTAMKLDALAISSTVRFGIGRFNTHDEIDVVVEAVAETVQRLRRISVS